MMEWIKLSTTMFEDDKIRLIMSEKNGDELVTVWMQLLCLAGKQDHDGVFMLSETKAYTIDQIATILMRDKKRFKDAIDYYESLGMVTVVNGCVTLPNWGKYNSDSVTRDTYKQRHRERQQRYRDRQRDVTRDVTECHESVTVTQREKEKENNIITTTSGTSNNSVTTVTTTITQKILDVWCNLPQIAIQEINSFREELPDDVIEWALNETLMHPGAGYKYLQTILQRCVEQGLTTLESVKQAEADRKALRRRAEAHTSKESVHRESMNYQQREYANEDEFYTSYEDWFGKGATS